MTVRHLKLDQEFAGNLLRKGGRKLRREHSAAHTAIVEGAPNRLSFEYRGANVR